MVEFEIIFCLRLILFFDKMKIEYKLRRVFIVYVKCRCLLRIIMLKEIFFEIGFIVIIFF